MACTIVLLSTILNLTNLPSTQTKRLQLFLNADVRAVTKTPKFHHLSTVLESHHWLKNVRYFG
jgi:hypothetical protein